MSNLVSLAQEQMEIYEKQLLVLKVNLRIIYEFCLSAEIEFRDNKNDFENHELKKYLKNIKKIMQILDKVI